MTTTNRCAGPNRLAQVSPLGGAGSILSHFTYAADGNLAPGGRQNYTSDAESRLVKLTARTGAGPQISLPFDYDWPGRRLRQPVWNDPTWCGNLTHALRCVSAGGALLARLNSPSSVRPSFRWGLDLSGSRQGAGGIGGLLARTDHAALHTPQSALAHAYYHCDGNGNVTCLVDTNGQVVARYNYDPYGNLLGMSGPLAGANTYRFSSKEWNGNAGLYYYGYRFYEPNLQRWLNQDPLEEFGGLNLHQFVFNDPINLTDKDGRIPPLPIVGAIIYFSCTAIVNAPGPDDETFPPYHDAPDPVTVYCACLFPGATVGFNLGETIAEDLGVPAEAVMAAGMMIPGGMGKAGAMKARKVGQTAKEAAKDIPSWATGARPFVNENGKDFAKRLLDQKYGSNKYPTGPGSEFNKLKKYCDRAFE